MRRTRFPAAPAVLLAGTALCVTGCTVGPKYHAPTAIAPTATSYRSSTLTNGAGVAPDGSTWQPAAPSDAMLRGKWWQVFGDPQLNTLEDQVTVNNQTIKQSFEQFMEARALIREARAQLFPTASIGPAFKRSRSSSNLKGSSEVLGSSGNQGGATTGSTGTQVATNTGEESTLWSAPLDISWEPDLWGKIRNTIHQDEYSAQVSAADLENEQLTEQAALAEAYFELRGEDALQTVLNQLVTADRASLAITQGLYETGVDDQISVVEARATLQSAESQAIAVAAPRATYEHAIATLVGEPATDFHLAAAPANFTPPPIPIGVPSQLLQRRPDVAAAERTMAAANAQIGIGEAAFFPQLTLSAQGGFEASTLKHWFDWPSRFWSIGPTFSQPIYQAGLTDVLHQYAATYNADVAAYQQTVLTAFQQVEDYLAEVRIDSQQAAKVREAVLSDQTYVNLALDRYKTGLDPYLNVITAQNSLLTNQQTLYTTEMAEMTAAVQLVQALGGGWTAADLPTPKQVEAKTSAAQNAILR